MDSFKKQIENLESTDIFDIDMNVFKNEFRKILSGDFSKVFGSKFVENLISEVELVLSLGNDFIFSENYNNKGNETIFVNDILDYNIIMRGISIDILGEMELNTFHKISHNLNSVMGLDGSIKGKDRVFRIISLLYDIYKEIEKKFPFISSHIGGVFNYFLSNYLLNVYDKANDLQKVNIKKYYNTLGENNLNFKSIPLFINIYDMLFDDLNKDRYDIENYDKDRLEKLSYTKILTNDFKNEFKDYDIILYNGNSEFKSIIEGKIIFKNYDYEINLNIMLGSFEMFSDIGTRISNLFNDKAYSILSNDILSFYLESLENSDNPTNEVLEGNTITIRSEDLKYTKSSTKDNIYNVLLDKKIKSDDQLYKETLDRIKSKSSKELINAFTKLTKLKTITGSHHIFNNKELNSSFPVPLSKGTIPIGTLNSIIRLSGFSIFEISEKL